MKLLATYLSFQGNCEEALNFYAKCLGGEILSIQRFGDAPGDHPEEFKDKVMHAEFKAGDIFFMASDSMPNHPFVLGTNITLSINLDDKSEQTTIFDNLSEGGNVMMPLQKTFWGARFGMLTDKFGVNWMLNCGQRMPAT